MAVTGAISAATAIRSSQRQKKASARAENLAKRQAAVQNTANANAAMAASTRDRLAAEVEANQQLANDQLTQEVDATINTPETPNARKRQQNAKFRGEADETGALRI